MRIEELIVKVKTANDALIDSINKLHFQDNAILAELKSFSTIVGNSLKKVEQLIDQEVQLKNTLQSEMKRVRKLIEAKIDIIESKGTNFFEKVEAVELLGNISSCYLLDEQGEPQPERKPIDKWHDDRLRLEQQVVCKEQKVMQLLKEILGAIKEMAENNFEVPNRCYISYAWTARKASHEKWVKLFLNHLQEHLNLAGINVLLDIKDNLMNNSVYQYMSHIKNADCVIVVGTQGLFEQHESGVGNICNELILIEQNREKQQGKTLPILLSGCWENSFPPYFFMYSKITDWREHGYISNLKKLIANIYGIGTQNAAYQQLWSKFESQYPILTTGFPEESVYKQLITEENLNLWQKELSNQQAMELFKHINENALNQLGINNLNQFATITWETLIKCVKDKYIKENQVKTILGKGQEIANCYVNLAIIEEEEQKNKEQELAKHELDREEWLNSYEQVHGIKKPIALQDIFKLQNGNPLKRQLILGRAGIGKSVLCQYLAYQWAKEEWWKDEPFKLLVWIPLRQLANKNIYPKKSKAMITLGKILYEQFKEQLHTELPASEVARWIELLDNLINEHHSEILYILDGFDEVAAICQLDAKDATRQSEVFHQLLKQDQIIITSRPYYIDYYLSSQGIKIERRLENIGFVDKDIKDYVRRYLWKEPQRGEALQSVIDSNSMIRGIAHIPINLALLCRHWNFHHVVEEDTKLSLTVLYEELVAGLLYERLSVKSGKGYINFFSSTSRSILNNKKVKPIMSFLEKLAFLQMQEDTLIIKKERMIHLLDEFEEKIDSGDWQGFKAVLDAGLLVSPDEEEQEFQERKEHYFVHLTFQEFLAARYIAQVFKQEKGEIAFLEKKEQTKKVVKQALTLFIQEHKYDLRYEIILWFVAGLLKEHVSGLERFFNNLLAAPREIFQYYDGLLWIKCLEECELSDSLNAEFKNGLLEKIKERTQVFIDSKVLISKEGYLKTWFDYLNSSPMVFEKIGILRTKEAVRKGLGIFRRQSNLSAMIVEVIVDLLSNEKSDMHREVQRVLSKKPKVFSDIFNNLVDLRNNKKADIRRSAQYGLDEDLNLSIDVSSIINLLNEDVAVSRLVPDLLGNQLNLSLDVLSDIISLLNDKEADVRRAISEALGKQTNLSSGVLNSMIGLLNDKEADVRCAAGEALVKQTNLPLDILNSLISLLNDNKAEVYVRSSVLNILGKQTSLPSDVLSNMVSLLHDEEVAVRGSACKALGEQSNLSLEVSDRLVNLLTFNEAEIKWSALYILRKQMNLSEKTISYLIDSMNANEEDWLDFEKINFVKKHLMLILSNQKLQSKLVGMPALLFHVILENAFLSKNVVYFKDDHLLIMRLGQQFKQLVIKDKNNFINSFNIYYQTWSNGQESSIIYDNGQAKFQAKDYVGAIADYTEVLNLNHRKNNCYTYRGWARMLMNDYVGAINDASKGIFLAPENANFYRNRAWAYLFDSKIKSALKDVEQALYLEQNSGEAYCILALIYFKQGSLKEAIKTCRQAVKLEADKGYLIFILAQLYRYGGNESAYCEKITKAQQLGDNQHLFNLLEKWFSVQSANLLTEITEKLSFISLKKSNHAEELLNVNSNIIPDDADINASPVLFLPLYRFDKNAETDFNNNPLKEGRNVKIAKPN